MAPPHPLGGQSFPQEVLHWHARQAPRPRDRRGPRTGGWRGRSGRKPGRGCPGHALPAGARPRGSTGRTIRDAAVERPHAGRPVQVRRRAHPPLHPLGPRDGHRVLDGRVPERDRLAGRALWHGDLGVRAQHRHRERGALRPRHLLRGRLLRPGDHPGHDPAPGRAVPVLQALLHGAKPGGYIAFLATPNTNSPFYRLKKTLPFIDAPRNFYIPDDVGLAQTLTNFGFVVRETRYPYLGTPYAHPLRDHWRFLRNILSPRSTVIPHAFWRSSMEMIAQKPVCGRARSSASTSPERRPGEPSPPSTPSTPPPRGGALRRRGTPSLGCSAPRPRQGRRSVAVVAAGAPRLRSASSSPPTRSGARRPA